MKLGVQPSSDTIFIVAHDTNNQVAIKKILEKEGYYVKISDNYKSILLEIEKEKPCLIVLDFFNVEFNKYEVCRKLKTRESTKDIPVIIMDSSTSPLNKAKAFEAGSSDLITKPYHPIEVVSRVKNHVELYKARKFLIENIELKTIQLKNTKEKQVSAEKKLLLNEAILREAQQMAQLGYWEWDIKSGKVIWSEEVYKIFQLNPDEFVPQINSILDLSPWPEDHARDQELIRKAIESREQGTYEQRFLRPDGSIGYYQSTFQGIFDDEGTLIKLHGVVQDITKRKLAENALKESEIKYRRLVESLKNEYFFYSHNTEGVFTYVSPSITNILGYSENEFLQHFSEYMTKSEINKNVKTYTDLSMKGVEQEIYDVEIYHKNGETHTLEVKEVPIFDNNGKVIAVEGIAHDITEKRRIHEKIKQLNKGLEKKIAERTAELENANKLIKAERDKIQMYLDIADVIILTLDLNGDVTMINKKGCEVFGYPENQIIGKNWFKHLKDETNQEEEKQRFLKTTNSNNKNVNYNETYIITKDGRKKLIAWRDINILNKEGVSIGMLSSGEDITERKALENHLINAKIEASEANRAKSEFLANMSHEIRTPMNSILGFAELLSNSVSNNLQKSYLDSIKSSGRNLLTLINDILDFSRIEAGKMQIEYKQVNLYAISQEMSAIFSLEIADKGLEFIMNIDPKVPSIVYMDEIRLRQVMMNLLNNAVKFTEQGHVKLSVSCDGTIVDSDKKFCNLIIKIEDTGIGIPKDSQEKIFQAFIQQEGQSVKKHGGTGLGLAISRTLTKLMNGSIELDSEESKGSTFKLVFNKVEIAETIPESEATESIDPKTVEFINSKVLIVADIEDNRNYLAIALKNYNLHLLQASSEKEALSIMESEVPDLVIADLRMPFLNGTLIQQQLQNHPQLKKIPVIAVSDSVMKDALSKVEGNNFAAFLKKPFRVGQLLSEIIKHIPYKIVNDKEKEKEKQLMEKVSKIKLVNIDAFLNVLAKLDKLHKPLVNRQPVKDVKSFASACISVAKEFNILVLKEYGKSLNKSANNFDIDALLKQINSYKQLTNKIKDHISKTE